MALCPPGKKSCSDVIRASWNEEKDEFLVSQLQIQSDRGKRAVSGFKKEAWRSVTTASNEQFAVVYLPAQVKSRLDTLKKEFKDFKYLKDNSGFGWDDICGLPTAPDDVWAAVIETNKNYRKFQTTPFPLFEQLAVLLDGCQATGNFALGPPITGGGGLFMSEERDEGVSLSPLGEQADASDNDICSGESGTARRPKRRALAGRVTPQRDRRSAGFVIGEAMSKLVELEIAKTQNSNQVPLTQDDRVANAIDILMKNYQYLDSDDLATIADVFGNGCNATIFAKLTGAARDAWISKKLK